MTLTLALQATIERYRTAETFSIAGHSWDHIDVLWLRLEDGTCMGQGEGIPIYYRPDESPQSLKREAEALIAKGVTQRSALMTHTANGATNALDAALWDLEAKQRGQPVWALSGLPEPVPRATAMTISLDSADAMGKAAARLADYPLLKLKLGHGNDEDLDCAAAVRAAAPNARLIIDANGGWSFAHLQRSAPVLEGLGIELIEQPLAPGADDPLASFRSPVPLCADESFQTQADIAALADRYQLINIKLDKCGGLTAALAIARRAQELQLGLMVGNMLGTSLAMAPAYHLAGLCRFADLDGPLLLGEDRAPAARYDRGTMQPPDPGAWGMP
ncbi:MAG: dipeptide epimerase [Pseudomonadota bacterium]